MSLDLPSQDERQLCRCRALYLGTNIYKPKTRRVDEAKLSLSLLQNTIAERYPIDGTNYSKGIETWLSIYPSGLQMEHSSLNDSYTISALFYYPIKSLVYCGALRYISENINNRFRLFEPLDSEIAQTDENTKNPPLFVVFLKGIDPTTKTKIIECSIFVIGKKNTAMRLVEASQTAFNTCRLSVDAFYSKYGNIPAVFCSKEEIKQDHKTNRVSVKKFDSTGYFYATRSTSIDLWQLVDDLYAPSKSIQPASAVCNNNNNTDETSLVKPSHHIDPYEKTDNLVSVEKLVDPVTGQNIYVRYLNENGSADVSQSNKLMYDVPDLVYTDEKLDYNTLLGEQQILVRQEKTPSPIIVEKYIKKKAPQVIIKEIHVQEPAPPPIKLVQKVENSQIPVYASKKASEPLKSTHQPQQTMKQPNYYKPQGVAQNSVQNSSRKPLYNRVGQPIYSGVDAYHKSANQYAPPPPKLGAKVTHSQPPDPYQHHHHHHQSKLPNPYRPAHHSMHVPSSSNYHNYYSTSNNISKYASVSHNHVNHSSLSKSKYETEPTMSRTQQQQQQATSQSVSMTTSQHQAQSKHLSNSTYADIAKLPAKSHQKAQTPSEYKNTYDLIENVENLIEKSKKDENKNHHNHHHHHHHNHHQTNMISNNKGRKIYVIHQNEAKSKSSDKKYHRKIIVIDEPDDTQSEQQSTAADTTNKSAPTQETLVVNKKKSNDSDLNDLNFYNNIDKKQPIKRGDKPYYSHR